MNESTSLCVNSIQEVIANPEQFLERSGELTFSEDFFKLEASFEGAVYSSTLDGNLIKALAELQDSIYHAYSLFKASEGNSNRLTNEEKDKLLIIVEVSNGCTNIKAVIKKAIELSKTLNKMDKKTKLAIFLLLSICFGGPVFSECFKAQKDTERYLKTMEVIEKAIPDGKERELIRAATAEINQSKINLIKNAKAADFVKLGGETYTKDDIYDLNAKNRRAAPTTKTINEKFRIVEINNENDDLFKVKLLQENGNSFMATIQTENLFPAAEDLNVLFNYQIEKKFIDLTIIEVSNPSHVSREIVSINE